jgi:hypothetical protein
VTSASRLKSQVALSSSGKRNSSLHFNTKKLQQASLIDTITLFPFEYFFFSPYKIKLEVIGNVLEKIEKFIKNIPFVGSLWKKFEEYVGKIIAGIFDFFGIKLPNFGLDLSPLTGITDTLDFNVDNIFSGIDQLLQVRV